MPPRGKQFTPAEKLLESQNCSVRGACGFVLTAYAEVSKATADPSASRQDDSARGEAAKAGQ